MGMTAPGKVMLACGTAWVITAVVNSPDVAAVPAGMDLNFHVLPHRWTISQLLAGWEPREWLLQAPGFAGQRSRPEIYSALNETLRQTEPGSHGCCLSPSPRAQRRAGSSMAAISGLRLDHTGRGDIWPGPF